MHIAVLMGWWTPSLPDVVAAYPYFWIDAGTVVVGWLVVRRCFLRVFLLLHTAQHLYYIAHWNTTDTCSNVIAWTARALPSDESVYIVNWVGTAFDAACHVALCAYYMLR